METWQGTLGDMAEVMRNCIVFGSSGYLGGEIASQLSGEWNVIEYRRDVNLYSSELSELDIDAAVFAQGVNYSSGIQGASQLFRPSIEANVTFILERIEELSTLAHLSPDFSIVILSSVWQRFSRAGKIPYVTSKSAIEGLVKALAGELGASRRVNAVLPGVVDSPMARKALTAEQFESVIRGTPSGKLVAAEEVAALVEFLISPKSSGLNGQSIVIDRGWTANVQI